MTVRTIIDNATGSKWEIIKNGNDDYEIKYYEFYESLGWRMIGQTEEHYSKDAIEWEFDRKVA